MNKQATTCYIVPLPDMRQALINLKQARIVERRYIDAGCEPDNLAGVVNGAVSAARNELLDAFEREANISRELVLELVELL